MAALPASRVPTHCSAAHFALGIFCNHNITLHTLNVECIRVTVFIVLWCSSNQSVVRSRALAASPRPPVHRHCLLPTRVPPPPILPLRLPKFFQPSFTTSSSSPDLTKAASPSPGLRQPPGAGSSSKPTFASALRDLAKNAGDGTGEPQRRPGPPTPTPVASTLQDVRKVRTILSLMRKSKMINEHCIDSLK